MESFARWLDMGVLIFLFLGMIMGYFRGIIGEVIKILALVAGSIGAFFFMDFAARYLMDHYHLYYLLAHIVGFFILFCATLVLTPIIHMILNKIFLGERKISIIERALGLVFGGVKNALISGVLLGVLVMVPGLKKTLEPSISARAYHQYLHPLFTRILGKDNPLLLSEKLPLVLEDKNVQKKLMDSPSVQEFAKDRRVRDLWNDPEIQELIKRQDVRALLQNEKLNALMKDPDFRDKLKSISNELTEAIKTRTTSVK